MTSSKLLSQNRERSLLKTWRNSSPGSVIKKTNLKKMKKRKMKKKKMRKRKKKKRMRMKISD